ncbi:penicillin acylase family protein [Candidatus Acetothermia bacterium]|nr:penicillin acylase family protein [Candidatus Acetothermia bacterium]
MRSFILGLLVVGLVAALSQPPSAQQSSTVLTPVTIPGLQQPVKVVQDIYGIPHVFAQNALDLYRVVGYLHARDRLFQMDTTRRTANGTLAELVGPSAIGQDVQLRTLGLRRAAELSEKASTDEEKADMQAYADGVNAFIQQASAAGQLPPQYKALELTKVDPWTTTDSFAIGKALAFQLSFDIDAPNVLTYFKYREVGGKQGFNGNSLYFDDLFRSAPGDPAVVVRDAEGKELANTSASSPELPQIDPNTIRLLEKYYDQIKDIDFFKPILKKGEDFVGSNWLLVSGKNTDSGFPLLFNDPHLALDNPSIWYEIDQKVKDGAELNVVGTTFPGVPYVVLGHTDKIAWAATVNPLDVTDMFQESITQQDGKLFTRFRGQLEPVVSIAQSYKVNIVNDNQMNDLEPVPSSDSVPAATLIVPRHGPVAVLDLNGGLAVTFQYTGFYATREIETFRAWNRAKNIDDFKKGLLSFDAGSQNWGYADVEGNIAYFTGAESPLREDLEMGKVDLGLPPFFVRDGSGSGLHQWLPPGDPDPTRAIPFAILPPSEMPQTINPANGFIVSANNDPAGNTIDNDPLNQKRAIGGIYYLDWVYDIGFRAGRITELVKQKLANGGKISLKDMQQIQADTVSLIGRRITPHILKAFENATGKDASEALATVAKDARVAEAVQKYLSPWSFATPTGIREGFDGGDNFQNLPDPSAKEITDSVASTLFHVWLSVFISNVIDGTLDRLDKSMQKPDSFFSVKAILKLLENFDKKKGKGESGIDFFDAPEVQSEFEETSKRDVMILLSLKQALDLLASDNFAKAFNKSTKLEDYRWGRLHKITLRSAIHRLTTSFSIPPTGSFDKPEYADGLPVDGTFATVDVARYDLRDKSDKGFKFFNGPSQRHVVELNPKGIRDFNAFASGESSIPGNKHYADILPFWLVNNYFPVYYAKGEIESNSESSQDFVPGK